MDDLPALRHFLGAYLHQDWSDEFATADEAVDAFVHDEPGRATTLGQEVSSLLASAPDEARLRKLVLDDLGSGYYPPGDGLTFQQWLRSVRTRLP